MGLQLSPTLLSLASMSKDEAHYWGSEAYQYYGERVYQVYKELTSIPPPLRKTLKTVWVSLWAADDIG